MKATFIASDTHIPTAYFDDLVALSAPFPVSDLSWKQNENIYMISLGYLR